MSQSSKLPPLQDHLLNDDDDDDLFVSAIEVSFRDERHRFPIYMRHLLSQNNTSKLSLSTTTDEPIAPLPVDDMGPGEEIDLGTDDEKQAGANGVTAEPAETSGETSAVLPASAETRVIQSANPRTSLTVVSSSPVPGSEAPEQTIEIGVGEPRKVGDGYGSYVVYRVSTKTNMPFFRRNTFSVSRRFSDFRGLRDKLAEKHLHSGRIVPPAPEKDAVGTAKVKMSKEDDVGHDDFIEKRRMALERYLNRTAAHPVLRADPDFREFLELDTELPKSTGSSALSGAGVRRFLNKFGDTVNKMTFKMEEADSVSGAFVHRQLTCFSASCPASAKVFLARFSVQL